MTGVWKTHCLGATSTRCLHSSSCCSPWAAQMPLGWDQDLNVHFPFWRVPWPLEQTLVGASPWGHLQQTPGDARGKMLPAPALLQHRVFHLISRLAVKSTVQRQDPTSGEASWQPQPSGRPQPSCVERHGQENWALCVAEPSGRGEAQNAVSMPGSAPAARPAPVASSCCPCQKLLQLPAAST